MTTEGTGHTTPIEPARTLAATLHTAAERLLAVHSASDIDDARLQVELLYARAAGVERAAVVASGGRPADTAALATFDALLNRRLAHEPLAYILGEREFFGLSFLVGPGALVPRPETETLVERVLAATAAHPAARRLVRVADVGTGSGAVALSVARHAPNTRVYAIDTSTEALAWAGRNRARLAVQERVVLLHGDLLEPVPEPLEIVAANLPYIPTEEYERLPDEIRRGEPRLAVDGGEDGLALYRQLFAQLPTHLAEGPVALLFEIGAGQAGYAAELAAEVLGAPAVTHRDLLGIRRVVEVRRGY